MDNLNKISKNIFRKTLFINNENTFRTFLDLQRKLSHITT